LWNLHTWKIWKILCSYSRSMLQGMVLLKAWNQGKLPPWINCWIVKFMSCRRSRILNSRTSYRKSSSKMTDLNHLQLQHALDTVIPDSRAEGATLHDHQGIWHISLRWSVVNPNRLNQVHFCYSSHLADMALRQGSKSNLQSSKFKNNRLTQALTQLNCLHLRAIRLAHASQTQVTTTAEDKNSRRFCPQK